MMKVIPTPKPRLQLLILNLGKVPRSRRRFQVKHQTWLTLMRVNREKMLSPHWWIAHCLDLDCNKLDCLIVLVQVFFSGTTCVPYV